MPNTNQHSVEGSNPVWRRDMEPDNWFKQQDSIYQSNEHDALESLDVNAILGSDESSSTPRNSHSDANTASIGSTNETYNR